MNPSVALLRSRPELDAFLFAPVGVAENSGMPLSVISVLGRLDLDPWQEAGKLAAMSRESAAQNVASLLAATPGAALTPADLLLTATRLVSKLPPHLSASGRVARPQANAAYLGVYLIIMAASQFLWGHFSSTQTDVQKAQPASSSALRSSAAPGSK